MLFRLFHPPRPYRKTTENYESFVSVPLLSPIVNNNDKIIVLWTGAEPRTATVPDSPSVRLCSRDTSFGTVDRPGIELCPRKRGTSVLDHLSSPVHTVPCETVWFRWITKEVFAECESLGPYKHHTEGNVYDRPFTSLPISSWLDLSFPVCAWFAD